MEYQYFRDGAVRETYLYNKIKKKEKNSNITDKACNK